MIFLILFGFIALIVIVLNTIDNSNLEKIETHFKKSACKNIIYSKGAYKGICKDEVMQIPNSFSVDLENDKTYYKFSKIEAIKIEKLNILINDTYKIEFKDKKNQENFYKALEEKIVK